MPFGYLSVVFSFFIDIIYYDDDFDLMSIIGMCLTSSGLLLKFMLK